MTQRALEKWGQIDSVYFPFSKLLKQSVLSLFEVEFDLDALYRLIKISSFVASANFFGIGLTSPTANHLEPLYVIVSHSSVSFDQRSSTSATVLLVTYPFKHSQSSLHILSWTLTEKGEMGWTLATWLNLTGQILEQNSSGSNHRSSRLNCQLVIFRHSHWELI